MSEPHYLPRVREQYEDYPYPLRRPEDEMHSLFLSIGDELETISHYGFGGKRDLRNECRVLVAGGGTGDATIWLAEQLRGYDAEIVHLDISEASLTIAKERAKVRQLENILWHHGSLLDLPALGLGTFDYINCSGVLHHLADPSQGLAALKTVLAPDGIMGLMVYGLHARAGVYQMQALMRLITQGSDDIPQHLAWARNILASLPATNVYKHCEKLFSDVEHFGDIGIYDLFLHTQDRAYSVPELYEWIENGGLHLLAFSDPAYKRLYDPATFITEPGLLARIRALSLRDQQAVGELLSGAAIKHGVYVSPQKKRPPSLSDQEMVPMIRTMFYTRDMYAQILAMMEKTPQKNITLLHDLHKQQITIPNTAATRLVFKYLDGARSIGQIYRCAGKETAVTGIRPAQIKEALHQVYTYLEAMGWMVLRHRNIPFYPSIDAYIEQQKARSAA